MPKSGLPDRPPRTNRFQPYTPAGPSSSREPEYVRRYHDNHVGPVTGVDKPRGKGPVFNRDERLPPVHSREFRERRSHYRQTQINFVKEKRAEERQRILDGPPKPTLEQRLAAIPLATYTPIAPKPITIDFDKHTLADLAHIFAPKFEAVLKRLDVDRKSTRLNSSHSGESRMPSSA